MKDSIRIWKDAADEWRWTRRSGNNKIVATSGEGYVHRDHAIRMAFDVNGGEFTVADESGEFVVRPEGLS